MLRASFFLFREASSLLRLTAFVSLAAFAPLPQGSGGGRLQAAEGSEDEDSRLGGDGGAARAMARAGEYDAAIESYREQLEKYPDRTGLRRGLAEALAAQGNHEEALETLRSAKIYDTSADLLAAAGRIYASTGKLGEAERAYRSALNADDEHVEALVRLGEVLRLTGRADEAEALWNRVVEIYEDLSYEDAEKLPAEVFVEIGVALRFLNRFHDANEVMFPQARDQDEKCPSLLLEWGLTFMQKYDFPESRRILRKALGENPRFADALVLMAENYLLDFQVGTRRYKLAEEKIAEALEVNPRHAGAYRARGSLWLSDGHLRRAVADFEKSLDIDPSSLRTLGLLAACHHLSEGEAEYNATAKRALAINPRAAEFYHTIAMAVEKRFRYADAVEMSGKALELDPDYWPAYHTLAINYLRTGKEELGREFLQKSYDNDPFNIWVVNTRKLLRHVDQNHREFKTEHFQFRFPKGDYDVLKAYLAPLLEKAYEKLAAHYRVTLEPPIYVDVFSGHQWFSAKIVGLGGFPATGACFGNVVALTTPKAVPQNWGAVAWHEFAHVITLAATKNRVPRWLTEGLSVYEEGRDHPGWRRYFERQIADAYGSGRLLKMGELDSGFSKPKYPGQVLISYFQGCLVVQYISEKWSFDKVLEILAGYAQKKTTAEVFRNVLGRSLGEFDAEFTAWLDRWVQRTGYEPALAPETVTRLELAVEENPRDVKLLCDLAWAYFSNDNDIDAPLTAAKALKLDPENGDALAILGFTQFADKKHAAARKSLLEALERDTRFDFRVHEHLGRLALIDRDRATAIEHFEKAKEISPRAGAGFPPGWNPRRRNIYVRLADLYNKEGNEESAIQQLEELRAFAAGDPNCRLKLMKHYLVQETEEGDRKAYEVLGELVYVNPFDMKIHEQLARVAARLGKHRVAIREYTFLLKSPDTNPRVAYLALAKAHLALDNTEEARKFAQKVLGIDEDNEEAREILEKLAGE